jgi:ABC-type multidrug transport system permease subunit
MSIFETIMLLCFGSAWPFSIYTSYKSRTAKGKSLLFLVVLLIGYFAGTMHKILYSFDYVIILYILNFLLIAIDTLLYFRNRRLDLKRNETLLKE